ncbi:MAG: hypothetical protein NUW37_18715 [Planctomycetes bacterium]|nr:hypothetical protein [Planctomycetota bacterium]
MPRIFTTLLILGAMWVFAGNVLAQAPEQPEETRTINSGEEAMRAARETAGVQTLFGEHENLDEIVEIAGTAENPVWQVNYFAGEGDSRRLVGVAIVRPSGQVDYSPKWETLRPPASPQNEAVEEETAPLPDPDRSLLGQRMTRGRLRESARLAIEANQHVLEWMQSHPTALSELLPYEDREGNEGFEYLAYMEGREDDIRNSVRAIFVNGIIRSLRIDGREISQVPVTIVPPEKERPKMFKGRWQWFAQLVTRLQAQFSTFRPLDYAIAFAFVMALAFSFPVRRAPGEGRGTLKPLFSTRNFDLISLFYLAPGLYLLDRAVMTDWRWDSRAGDGGDWVRGVVFDESSGKFVSQQPWTSAWTVIFVVTGYFFLKCVFGASKRQSERFTPRYGSFVMFLLLCAFAYFSVNVIFERNPGDPGMYGQLGAEYFVRNKALPYGERESDVASPKDSMLASHYGPLHYLMHVPAVQEYPTDTSRAEGFETAVRPDFKLGDVDVHATEMWNGVDWYAAKLTAAAAFVLLLISIVLAGWSLGRFDLGLLSALIYAVLPYPTDDFISPTYSAVIACCVLAFALRKVPLISGILIGAGTCALFYPAFLIPLWLNYYISRKSSWLSFILGYTIVGAASLSLIWNFSQKTTDRTMFGWYFAVLVYLIAALGVPAMVCAIFSGSGKLGKFFAASVCVLLVSGSVFVYNGNREDVEIDRTFTRFFENTIGFSEGRGHFYGESQISFWAGLSEKPTWTPREREAWESENDVFDPQQPWNQGRAKTLFEIYGLEFGYKRLALVAYLLFCALLFFVPRNLGNKGLLALTCAVIIGTQFWKSQTGGLYSPWYLPFLILLFIHNGSIKEPEVKKPAAESPFIED